MQSWKWRRGWCGSFLAGGALLVSLVGTRDLQAVEPRATATVAQATSVEVLQQQADIPGVRIHDLRHTFASLLVSGGASLEMIGKLLQHYQSSQNDAGSLGSQLSLSA
mgnify:CR=1 FL=1